MAVLVCFAASAVGSAQASSIAFIRQGNVWIAGSDGSQPRQLTSDGGTDGSVSYTYVSASKTGVPLLAYRHVNAIGVINPDGTGKRDITPGHAPAVGPDTVLSASGQALTYVSEFFIGGFQGFDGDTVNTDGSNPTHLGVSTVVDVSFGDPSGQTVLWAGYVHNAYGTASGPDCNVGGIEPFGLAVVVPDRDSTLDENVPTGYFCVTGQGVTQPRISPDGSTVLATLTAGDGSTRIISFPRSEMTSPFNPAGAHFSYVTPAGLDASDGDFSPDGTQIAFQGPGNTIYTVPAGGGSPTQILSEAGVPAWSPYTPPGQSAPGSPTVARCKVPKVIGKTLAAARKAITRAGCKGEKVTKRRSSRRNHGRVIAESPKAGKILAAGAKVNLAIGR